MTAGVRVGVEVVAQVRGILHSRGFGPKLLRRGGCDTLGMGGGWGDGGQEEFQRVIQTSLLRFSESFLEASVIFSRIWEGEHWPTLVIELLVEKWFPRDW